MITISTNQKLFKYFIISVLFCLTSVYSIAQKDTLFWFGAPNFSSGLGENPISLTIVTYDDPAVVTISQPANGSFLPITLSLAANSYQTVDLSSFITSIESPSADAINNNGLKISSTAAITAT